MEEARTLLRSLCLWGVGLYLGGSVVAMASWLSQLDSTAEDTSAGSVVGMILGGVAGPVRLALVTVALIGWGVNLGREASGAGR